MEFNYIAYLTEKLNRLKNDLQLNIELEIADEQDFVNNTNYTENKVYVVVRSLSSSISFYSIETPINITIISEQNQLEDAKTLFFKFAQEYNLMGGFVGTNKFLKQTYTTPIVMSNFMEVGNGYRSILYLGGTLYLTDNAIDVENLKIDGIPTKLLNTQIQYIMSGNTQPVGDKNIAETEKNMSTFTISGLLPFVSIFTKQTQSTETKPQGTYTINIKPYEKIIDFKVLSGTATIIDNVVSITSASATFQYKIESSLTKKILTIKNGTTSGNEIFTFTFTMDDIPFVKNMKLINSNIATAPDQIPSLQVSFME